MLKGFLICVFWGCVVLAPLLIEVVWYNYQQIKKYYEKRRSKTHS